MASASISFLFFSFFLAITFPASTTTVLSTQPRNTYLVLTQPQRRPNPFPTQQHWYASMLPSAKPILHYYDTVLHGFAVQLTGEEARAVAAVHGVAAVQRSRLLSTHTTRSPSFLGLLPNGGAWQEANYGDGVIVGVVDTGIAPDHPSFNDTGLGPVRRSWNGRCRGRAGFTCTQKIVGARNLVADENEEAAIDDNGHGTHVAATAAGANVRDAGVGSFARGVASGVAPGSRIAVYKACSMEGRCEEATVVAAIEAAVKDGVDVICLAVGAETAAPLYKDPIAVATFGAERRGISVVTSAGNMGPDQGAISNGAPWLISVGATNLDRQFPATLKLGNGEVIRGQSLYSTRARGTPPAGLVRNPCDKADDLTPDLVNGKLVFCGRPVTKKLLLLLQSSGAAGLVAVEHREQRSDCVAAGETAFPLPAIVMGQADGVLVSHYMAHTPTPTASFSFHVETVTERNRAPMVAGFSSRGPNPVAPEILKPDVVGPGIDIAAAWAGEGEAADFKMVSGTSVACAHVAGTAALIRSKRMEWKPSMVRSALVTGAKPLDLRGEAIHDDAPSEDSELIASPLAAGAGIVNPLFAMEPGLVYEAAVHEYLDFMCSSLGYTDDQVRVFDPDYAGCAGVVASQQLNTPAFVVHFTKWQQVRTVTRTVTHVADIPELYEVTVTHIEGFHVSVTPERLSFNELNERKSFTVTFIKSAIPFDGSTSFGRLLWKSEAHTVNSPVVVNNV